MSTDSDVNSESPTKRFLKKIMPFVDVLLLPFVYPAAWLLKMIRKAGVHRLRLCKKALLHVGVFPVRNHYYEPRFDMRGMERPLSEERDLPGINWNIPGQLELLADLTFADELHDVPVENPDEDERRFYLKNGAFGPGDAEYWYQLIRAKKPRRIFEIGGGYSTLMARRALQKNRDENPEPDCEHVCIEPYEMPWLEKLGVSVLRKKVEDIEISFFLQLEEDDILFIDSSHMIRPGGDVLFEYLELLPRLKPGVIVHLHDIFSPRNYPREWLESYVRFWNEQYLLEAFLTQNERWKIIGSLNHLHHCHSEELQKVCPFLAPGDEPSSFFIQKVT